MIADWSKVDLKSGEGQRLFIDLGWSKVFDVLDFTNTRRNNFNLLDVSSGLAFRAIKPGEKATVYKVAGEKVTVDFDLYGGVIDRWDSTMRFEARWGANKAEAHYDLISAARADSDVTWQGTDAETINYACSAILEHGFDASPNSSFVVVAPPQLMARLRNALAEAESQINYNVKLVVTSWLKNQALSAAETAKYFVALPGRKIKSGNRMDLTVVADRDIADNAETVAGWGRYGAIIGEVNQLRRCATVEGGSDIP